MGRRGQQLTLVGRQREMAVLNDEFGHVTSGHFSCVLVTGEPGVGKTRLMTELLTRAPAVGLSARAYPLGDTDAFGIWGEALERHLRALPATDVNELCGGFLGELAVLLRSAAAAEGSAPEKPRSRQRLLQGLTVLLANLASREGAVVAVLDDIHWADASSWDALQYLARNLTDVAVLVVAAARPVELSEHPVASKVLFGLEQEGLLTRLELEPLPTQAVSELAGAVLGVAPPPALVQWLDARSRGNPLFAVGLLRALQDEDVDLSRPQLRHVPEGLAERVADRLRGLDEPARSTLEVLATLGRRVDLREIVGVTGRSLDRLAPILDGLARDRLVVEEERAAEVTYEVAHPLIAGAIYQGIGTVRRRALHRLLARALLADGRLGEAAPHFARSAEVGDPEAVEALTDALRQAEGRGAYREALGVLGSLVDILPSGDTRWLDVADAMSFEAEWVVDHRADMYAALGIKALRSIDAALDDNADPARRASIQFRLASFLGWGTGEIEEAVAACREALRLFKQTGDRRALIAELELGWLEALGGDLPAAPAAGWRVARPAEAAGDRFIAMQAFGRSIGNAGWSLGRFAEAEAAHHRAAALAREDGREYFRTLVVGLLGLTMAFQGHIAEGRAYLEEAKSSPEWRETLVFELQAAVYWLAGDLEAAMAGAEESLAWNAGQLGRRRAGGLAFAAMSAVEAGRLDVGRRYVDVALAAYGDRQWWFFLDICHWAGAVVAWREQGAAAVHGLSRYSTRLFEMGALPVAAFMLVDLAEVAADAERADTAREAATRLEELTQRLEPPLYGALGALGSAWAELASGALKRAAEPAQRAVEFLATTECRLFHARALDVLGRSLAERDRPGAVGAFEQAASIFGACGATWRRQRSIDALGQLGARGRRTADAVLGPSSLTDRERQVARLAGQGLTARQIGERLFIGERTVESHLARAYAKLGVSSKAELVARATHLGL